MIPWDLHLLAVDRAEEGDTEATTRGVYSNKVFLFGPAAWDGLFFAAVQQRFSDLAGNALRTTMQAFASVTSILPRWSSANMAPRTTRSEYVGMVVFYSPKIIER
jgi:hypothetical protein